MSAACSSLQWALVQPRLAQHTRVCAYDRAGFGWSETAPGPLHSMVADLDTLLAAAGENTPYVLVGHSYGGLVIGEAADPNRNIKGLVFVAAFAAEAGETAAGLSGKFPGSSLGSALAPPVALSGGGNDLYIRQDKFHGQFAADVSGADAKLMASSQRPVTEAALNEPAAGAMVWKRIPSWFVYGDQDKNIPAAALGFMAERASSKKTVVVPGASHVVMVSHPQAVADLILMAARSK